MTPSLPLDRDELAGAIVIPPEFSQSIVNIGVDSAAGKASMPAQIELIRNSAVGAFIHDAATTVGDTVVPQVSATVNQQLVTQLEAANVALSPQTARAVGAPVVQVTTDHVAIGNRSGVGLTPFFAAVSVTLVGFAVASISHFLVGVAIGDTSIGPWTRRRVTRRVVLSHRRRWIVETTIIVVSLLAASFATVFMIVGVLQADVDSSWLLVTAFAAGGLLAVGLFTHAAITALGRAGELVALAILFVFGLATAGGVFPTEAMPPFFATLSGWLPLRATTDSLRSLFFFDGRAAGRFGDLRLLGLYIIGSLLVGGAAAFALDRLRPPEPAE